MGTREAKVEKYLDAEVKKLGGITRKWVSPGHDGVPDRIVRLPNWLKGQVIMVEVKTDDGKLSVTQVREHLRLNDAGVMVFTAYGEKGVDDLLRSMV